MPSAGLPSSESGPDRKTQLNELIHQLKTVGQEWRALSLKVNDFSKSPEPERGRTELGEDGWRALMVKADALINEMTNIDDQIMKLLDQ
jgi:hypothetical protein